MWAVVIVALYVPVGLAAPFWFNSAVSSGWDVGNPLLEWRLPWLLGLSVSASLLLFIWVRIRKGRSSRYNPLVGVLAALLGVLVPGLVMQAGVGVRLAFLGFLSGVLWFSAIGLGVRLLKDAVHSGSLESSQDV